MCRTTQLNFSRCCRSYTSRPGWLKLRSIGVTMANCVYPSCLTLCAYMLLLVFYECWCGKEASTPLLGCMNITQQCSDNSTPTPLLALEANPVPPVAALLRGCHAHAWAAEEVVARSSQSATNRLAGRLLRWACWYRSELQPESKMLAGILLASRSEWHLRKMRSRLALRRA